MNGLEPFHTVKWVASYLGVHPMTVYRLIHAGRLGAVRVGKSYRISDSTFRAYLKENETDGDARN